MKNLEKVRAELKARGVDGLIVYDELNQRYLSDFAFTDGLLLITENHAELITDFRYFEMAEKSADKDYHITMPGERTEYIGNILAEDGVKTLGFEGSFVAYEVYHKLSENYPNIELVDIGDMIERIRQIKTPAEIEAMQKAQDIADAAFSHIVKTITPNMTEIEVVAELEYVMRKLGSEGAAFDTIAVSGDASSLPHGTPRNCKLKHGFLTMDYGAKYNGYLSDMTRTIVIGRADKEMKKLYDTVLKAQLAALDFLRPGVDAGEADKVARDIIDAIPEFKGAFGHSLGHSIGLFVHERPGLSMRAFGNKTRVGEIYTVEPGIYLFGKYGCRIEDMVKITENGIYNFTHSSKEMIEIL